MSRLQLGESNGVPHPQGIDPKRANGVPHSSAEALLNHNAPPKPDNNDFTVGGIAASSPASNRRPSSLVLSELADEQIAALVQRVFVFPSAGAPRLVVFSSIDTRSRASWISFRTAELLAQHVSGSVCLVDANWRAPLLHRFARTDNSRGLAMAMIDPHPITNFAVPLATKHLHLVPSGSFDTEIPGSFPAETVCKRITELRQAFDYVLVDAPPFASSTDTVLLGQIADGVILIVEANATRRENARAAKEALAGAKVNLIGAILNNRTFPIPEPLYRLL